MRFWHGWVGTGDIDGIHDRVGISSSFPSNKTDTHKSRHVAPVGSGRIGVLNPGYLLCFSCHVIVMFAARGTGLVLLHWRFGAWFLGGHGSRNGLQRCFFSLFLLYLPSQLQVYARAWWVVLAGWFFFGAFCRHSGGYRFRQADGGRGWLYLCAS